MSMAKGIYWGLLLLLLAGILYLLRPIDRSAPYDPYFAQINQALAQAGIASPVAVLDLDRVDHNVDQIIAALGHEGSWRVVTKSIPSLELLDYVLKRSGSNRLMVFHGPYIALYAARFPQADLLLGKPLLVDSARSLLIALSPRQRESVVTRIQWLVDELPRLRAYRDLAQELGLRLGVNIEIDIGLHRGGVREAHELREMLAFIGGNPESLLFTGFMGYDAHVPFAPSWFGGPDDSFSDAMAQYANFVEIGSREVPLLFERTLTFNSGGSRTYARFKSQSGINDVAAGSAVVKPATFSDLTQHQAALFIAAPVLKRLDGIQMPFVDSVADALSWWNPNWASSLYLYGGGWPAAILAPQGVIQNSLVSDPPNQNLLPNQSLYHVAADAPLAVGDFVFFHPDQGDAISQFEQIVILRSGQIVDIWHPISRRY